MSKMFPFPIILIFLFVAGAANPEDDVNAILKFYQCLACGRGEKGTSTRMALEACKWILPTKFRAIERNCRGYVFPGLELSSDRWLAMCDGHPGITRKYYECIMEKQKATNANKRENMKLEEFKKCSREVDVKHCQAMPPEPV